MTITQDKSKERHHTKVCKTQFKQEPCSCARVTINAVTSVKRVSGLTAGADGLLKSFICAKLNWRLLVNSLTRLELQPEFDHSPSD